MIIISKDKKCLINSEHLTKIYICSGNGIRADLVGGNGELIAKYNAPRYCERALDMLAYALRNDDGVFEFPQENEMQFATQHTSQVTSMKKSHGGS